MSKSQLHAALLAVAVPTTVALFVLTSCHSGQNHARLQAALNDLTVRSGQVNDAVMRLGLELQTDYDRLTAAERRLRRWSVDHRDRMPLLADLDGRGPAAGGATPLERLIREKLVLSEDFKARHSIVRNASVGFERSVRRAASPDAPDSQVVAAMRRLERAGLRFYKTRSVADERALRGAIAVAEASVQNADTEHRAAQLAIRCARKMVVLHQELDTTLERLVASPIEEAASSIAEVSTRRVQEDAAIVRGYRVALMAAISALIAYCVYLCVAVARHAHALREANDNLEERVEERTRELTERTEQLQATLRNRDELRDALSEARRLEAIGGLAAGVAHEINTPLQFVTSNVQFLKSSAEILSEVLAAYDELTEPGEPLAWDERVRRVVEVKESARFEMIQEQIPEAIADAMEGLNRVVEIIRAMRLLTHPGSDVKRPLDVNEAVRSAVTITRNRWKLAAELSLHLDPALPNVDVFQSEINQVFINLIVNAADAVIEKNGESGRIGSITVSTKASPEGVSIVVEDDGCGMPESVVRRIFEPFYTTKEVGKGTGQGLALTHRVIVGRHGGAVDVKTAPGRGARFEITLPLEATEEPPEGAPPALVAVGDE